MNMFVATKASAVKGIDANSCETVTFHSKSKKQSRSILDDNESTPDKNKKPNVNNNIGDMKKLRYEIIKFGASGFSGRQKEDANVALMVSLGAQPPKKKARNYKEILTEKSNEKGEPEDGKYKSFSFPKKKGTNGAAKKNRRKDLKGLLNVYGEVNKNRKNYLKRKEKG